MFFGPEKERIKYMQEMILADNTEDREAACLNFSIQKSVYRDFEAMEGCP